MNIAIWFVSFQVAVLMLGPTYRNTTSALAPLSAPSPSLHGLPARLFALAGILGARKRIALLRDSMCRFVPRNRAFGHRGRRGARVDRGGRGAAIEEAHVAVAGSVTAGRRRGLANGVMHALALREAQQQQQQDAVPPLPRGCCSGNRGGSWTGTCPPGPDPTPACRS